MNFESNEGERSANCLSQTLNTWGIYQFHKEVASGI